MIDQACYLAKKESDRYLDLFLDTERPSTLERDKLSYFHYYGMGNGLERITGRALLTQKYPGVCSVPMHLPSKWKKCNYTAAQLRQIMHYSSYSSFLFKLQRLD